MIRPLVAQVSDAEFYVAGQRNSLPSPIVFCHNELRFFFMPRCCDCATFELDG